MRSFTVIFGFCGCLCAAGQQQSQESATFPNPDDLAKYVCEVASQKMIEEMATDKVCELIKAEFPGAEFEPDCKTVLENGWDYVAKYCPKGGLPLVNKKDCEICDDLDEETQAYFPNPEDLEKYVCEVASQQMIEDQATDTICALIKKEFPGVDFEPDCHTVLEKGWDMVKKYCPKGRLSMPSPEDVEKYVCEVATQKLIEEMATGKVCELIEEKFPNVKFNPDCRTAVEKVWNEVASFCPKGKVSMMPSPQEVEKYVCEVATQKLVEEMATDKVCELIKEKFPNVKFNPDCHTAVEKVWDKVASVCPKGLLSMPGPKDLEKYVCDVATDKMIESMATDKICELVKAKFPNVDFNPDCNTWLVNSWDRVAHFCTSGGPENLEKIVCEVLSEKALEKRAASIACAAASRVFPSMPSDCEPVLEGAWDFLIAQCPTNTTNALANPIPRVIEKLACKVLKRPIFEHRVLEVMCEEIQKEVHIPDEACVAILQRAWNKATAWCPVQAKDPIVV